MNNAPREALPASCPAPLVAIINKILAYQVDRRYATAAAIKADLDAFVADREPAAAREYITPPTLPIPPAPPRTPVAPVPPILPAVPPTDPLPKSFGAGGAVAVADAVMPAIGPPPTARAWMIRRFVWVALLFTMIGAVAMEGVATIAAERF